MARWRINADEPLALDYNVDFSASGMAGVSKSDAQRTALFSSDPFRLSEHDPIIVAFNPLCGDLNDDGNVDATDQALLQAAINKTPVERRYDLDQDGKVSGSDLTVFRSCLSQAK